MTAPLCLTPTLQQPTDLTLAVSERDIPGQVIVLRQERVAWHDLELTFAILGESHEVVIRRQGEVVLHERLSCLGMVGTGAVAHVHGFGDGLDHAYAQEGYAVRVEMQTDAPAWHALPRPNLFVEFPSATGDDTTPYTAIRWEADVEAFTWRTVHLYVLPHGTIGIVSASRISVHLAEQPSMLVGRTREVARP